MLALMRRAWILPALALACSRENPGFELAGASEATSGGSTSPTTAAQTTTDAQTTAPGTTGEPLPVCPQWPESALDLELTYNGARLLPPDDCSMVASYRGKGTLSTKTLTLTQTNACGENVTGDFTVEVGYVAFNFPIVTGCFEVQVEWNADCSAIRSVLLLSYPALFPQNTQWFAAGIVGGPAAPPGAPPALTPTLLLDEACSCDRSLGDCCASADATGPGSYHLDFSGVPLAPGESTTIMDGTATLTLANLRTHVHADCVDTSRHIDWYAVRTTL